MKTIQGDTWDILSIRAYGSAAFMDELIAANPEHSKTVIFPAGVELIVPEIDTAQTVAGLPPWKRRVSHA